MTPEQGKSLIEACESGDEVKAVTIGFEEFKNRHEDESPLAELVAKHYGIDHRIRIVQKKEFENDLPQILTAMDQPSIDGVNTWFASKAVAEMGLKVVLSGLGGDELFFGYPSFNQVPRLFHAMNMAHFLPGGDFVLKSIL